MNLIFIFAGATILASIVQYLISLKFKLPNNKYWFYFVSTLLLEVIVYATIFVGFYLFPHGDLALAAVLIILAAVLSIISYFYSIKKFTSINNSQAFVLLFFSGIIVVLGMFIYDLLAVGSI